MSELMNTQNTERGFRWRLLTTVSAVALLASLNVREVKAADEDTDRPIIWIELGGQMQHVEGQGDPFTPGFLTKYPKSPVLQSTTPVQAQNPPPFSFGGEGKITFQPESSDWVLSASVNYGRSSNNRRVDHQTNSLRYKYNTSGVKSSNPFTQADFANTKVQHRESHAILDFSVGKDVGLGMFGKDSSSTVSLGVRFVQFTSGKTFDIRARPDLQFKYLQHGSSLPYFHTYHATGHASRSFRGVGPSLSWSGSTPFAGNPQNGEIALDWGANAAVLFGKQKARVKHQEIGRYQSALMNVNGDLYTTVYHNAPPTSIRSHSVTVPNAGGFAGLSFRYSAAKLSLGYRADFFFNAMDVGIDARKSATLGFYGPFASVSVGIGG